MEETSKINPRLDEELKHETASITHGAGIDAHSRDDLRDQSSLDGRPNPAERPDIPDAPGSTISAHDAERRAELARVIQPATFPASRDELIRVAEQEHAPTSLVSALRTLPAGDSYENVQAVWAALGGATEGSHS